MYQIVFSVDNMLFEKEKISFYIGYGKKPKHFQVNEYKFRVFTMVHKLAPKI